MKRMPRASMPGISAQSVHSLAGGMP
jgi:hypothetical protein